MLPDRVKEELWDATHARIQKEMAKPRIAKSARKKYEQYTLKVEKADCRVPFKGARSLPGREAGERESEGGILEKY
jgi:hypothetical protein